MSKYLVPDTAEQMPSIADDAVLSMKVAANLMTNSELFHRLEFESRLLYAAYAIGHEQYIARVKSNILAMKIVLEELQKRDLMFNTLEQHRYLRAKKFFHVSRHLKHDYRG